MVKSLKFCDDSNMTWHTFKKRWYTKNSGKWYIEQKYEDFSGSIVERDVFETRKISFLIER